MVVESVFWRVILVLVQVKDALEEITNLHLDALVGGVDQVANQLLQERVLARGLVWSCDVLVDARIWHVDALLERNYNFHWIYFHLV